LRGCVKRFSPPAAAEFSSEIRLIFTISLREIVKMRRISKYYLARSAMKNLFTQLLKRAYSAAAGGKRLFTHPGLLMREPLSKTYLARGAEKRPVV
jgi:hypothetical protein